MARLYDMLPAEAGDSAGGRSAADNRTVRSYSYVFGYSKLDMLFGRKTEAMIRNPYAAFAKPGVRLLRETVTAIDAEAKRVTTDKAVQAAYVIVIALCADYDVSGTPGITPGVNDFYSVARAAQLSQVQPGFTGGDVVVGVCGAPCKCPPAQVDVDFLSGPKPFGTYHGASEALRVDKEHFGSSRRTHWIGKL